MSIPCQQLYDKKAARAVQVGDFAEDPNAKNHEPGNIRTQRVWIYEGDCKTFGITDDCKKCRWAHNTSRMIRSEQIRTRMGQAPASIE